MTATVRSLVHEEFPDHTIESIESQGPRPGNEAARVTFTDRAPVYVKVDCEDIGRLRHEIPAVRHASRHVSVNVPGVVAADSDAASPYLITEPLEGELFNERWTGEDERAELLRTVGETIAAVHETRVGACGPIRGWDDEDGLQIEPMDWTTTLCDTVRFRVESEFSTRFADLPDALLSTIRAVEPTIDRETAVLLHGDPNRKNIHVEPAGLLDWERALAGDAAFELAEAIFQHLGQPDVDDSERPALRDALLDGYRSRRGRLPARFETYEPLYRAIAYLLVAQTFDKWAPQADPPTDEIAENVREEAHARMSAAEAALS